MAIKVTILFILGSHNVFKIYCSQKAPNFQTPRVFNFNVSTHSDALKKKTMHFAGNRFKNSVETANGSWSAAGTKSLNPCHCFREIESAIPLLSEMTCTALILKL